MITTCIIVNAVASYGVSLIFVLLFFFSEWLGRNPKIKENDVYSFIHNLLKQSSKRS